MAALTPMKPQVVSGDIMSTVTMDIKGINTNIPWAAGQFLRVTSGGLLFASVTSASGSGGMQFYALSDAALGASGTDTVEATVGVITPDLEFEGNEYSTVAVLTNIGTMCGINVAAASTTGSLVTVDISATTYPEVVITNVGFNFDPAQYLAADTYAKLRFKCLDVAIDAARVS